MKPGMKATLTLIATLILGIVIGYIGHSTWHRLQHNRTDHTERDAGFVQRMEHILEPDSIVADTVRAVLLQHEARFKEARDLQRATMEVLVDSLIADLQGLIPEERIERLKRIRERGYIGRGRRPSGDRR